MPPPPAILEDSTLPGLTALAASQINTPETVLPHLAVGDLAVRAGMHDGEIEFAIKNFPVVTVNAVSGVGVEGLVIVAPKAELGHWMCLRHPRGRAGIAASSHSS